VRVAAEAERAAETLEMVAAERVVGVAAKGAGVVGGKGRDGGGMGEGWVRGRRWDGRRGS
jgi:hypothetical protein